MRISLRILVIAIAFWAVRSPAATHYVDLNSTNPIPPYSDWTTAATNIQDAINTANPNDTVLVTNGIYQIGGDSYNGSNRVDISNSVLVQSVNGPSATIIQGYQVPGTTNGPAAVRCAYIHQFGGLAGFTLKGGATGNSPVGATLQGGGLYAESQCGISNCIITGNASVGDGGGAFIQGATAMTNCIIAGNIALNTGYGGGVFGSLSGILVDCVISNNIAELGSGVANCTVFSSLLVGNGKSSAAYISRLNNCTLTANVSTGLGTAQGCTLNNSIIYYNSNGFYADCYQCNLTNCCTTIGPGTSSLSNNSFSNAPGFVNPTAGDYHLNPFSRCIDAGNSSQAANAFDLDGNPRIVGAAVDVGAYESQSSFQGVAHYVSLLSTNPVSPYTNWSTAATNIQDAVGVAQAGEFIIADDGNYSSGATIVFGAEYNRVVLTNPVTLVSAGGPQAAIISGTTQTRCIYVGTNATLIGFTLTNGHAAASGNITNEQSGGGAWCASGAVVSNCVVVGNFAGAGSGLGGAVFGGTIWNCVLTNNNAANGSGAALASLNDCLVISNGWQLGGNYGGGLYIGTGSNCTFTANWGYFNGGGVYQSTLYNCTLNTNGSSQGAGGSYISTLYGCTLAGNKGSTGGARTCTNYNCVLSGNSGADGGGADGGISYGCLFTGNSSQNGGGALTGNFYNCLFTGNRGGIGGGAENCTLYNCTVAENTATNGGGGTYNATGSIYNSIIYDNTTLSGTVTSNWSSGAFYYCCTTPLPPGGPGCFTNNPLLVNVAGGDLHLQSNSPCINSGNNFYVTNNVNFTNDFGGNPRIVSTAVDVGAYEFQSPASMLPYSWLWQYGLATDGSADFADSDGDGMSNYAEWRAKTNPTNALSVLSMQMPVLTETNATITWQSASGVGYYIQSTPNLFAQPFQSIASNIVGSAGTTSYTDTNALSGVSLFYRVGVQ